MSPLAFSDFSVVTCLGAGRAATVAALREGRSGLAPCTFEALPFPAYAGEVAGLDDPITGDFAGFDCRNNRLAALALAQDGFMESVAAARARYGAHRIGVFAGTSTSGLHHTEIAYRNLDAAGKLPPGFDYGRTHNTYSLARFVRSALGLKGPAFVVSTACAATSKVFASAARMIAAGTCDAAIVGGADTLCATTLFGFHALGVMSDEPCRPFDAERRGISIGEGAGFVLLERPQSHHGTDTILLLGTGESSDAYHMSSPHPEGLGARLAMQQALAQAGLQSSDIDYVNLHGTATLVGDSAEDRAISGLFGVSVPCSSTKGFTGHTLGASGAVEAVFGALAIQQGFIPGSPHTNALDPAFTSQYVLASCPAHLRRVVSNSFGFGGVNCSLVLGRDPSELKQTCFTSDGESPPRTLREADLRPSVNRLSDSTRVDQTLGRGRMIRVFVEGIGLWGPGLDGWGKSAPILAQAEAYAPAPTSPPPSALLPANERRRAVQIVKIALAAGAEAFTAAGCDPAETASVFASSGGDGETIHEILKVLASSVRELSPTRFHNSVHNAAAGYWSIATGSRAASSSLCGFDDSFAAGLLEASVQAASGQHAVAMIAYDVPYPAPLCDVRPIGAAFGVALVLSPMPSAAVLACIELELRPGSEAPTILTPELETLRRNTPAARSLPLLAALAQRAEAEIVLNYLDDMTMALKVTPQ